MRIISVFELCSVIVTHFVDFLEYGRFYDCDTHTKLQSSGNCFFCSFDVANPKRCVNSRFWVEYTRVGLCPIFFDIQSDHFRVA